MAESQLKSSTAGATRIFDNKYAKVQRNDAKRSIQAEVLRICSWENPIRSGVILAVILASIAITNRYTFLQIIFGILTIAVSVNLTYVCATRFFQTLIANSPATNPYSSILENRDQNLLNRDNVQRYTSLGVDAMETGARAVNRILFIEDIKTSTKWLGIFSVIWKISAYVSSGIMITCIIISAFIVPRLYMTNKNMIDARIQQLQAILNAQLQRAQAYASNKLAFASQKISAKTRLNATTVNPVKKLHPRSCVASE